MATLKSQNDRLLVVHEANAPLPKLDESSFGIVTTEGGLHRNVTVVSQFHDESLTDYSERVMTRVTRDLRQDVAYRGVVIAMGEHGSEVGADEWRRLVHSLAAMLALRPNGALLLCAPMAADPLLRLRLLELAGSVARGAPNLDVRVVFPQDISTKSRKRVKRSHSFSLDA